MMEKIYNEYARIIREISNMEVLPLVSSKTIIPTKEITHLNTKIYELQKTYLNVLNSYHIKLDDIKLIQAMLSNQCNFVYFMKNSQTGLIKIGKTIKLNQRIKQIQIVATQIGIAKHQLSYMAIIYCPRLDVVSADYLETYFHSVFAQKRKIGEWFNIQESDVIDLIYGYFDFPYIVKDENNNKIHIATAFYSDSIKQLSIDNHTPYDYIVSHNNIYDDTIENLKLLYYINIIAELINNDVIQSFEDFNKFVGKTVFIPILQSLYNYQNEDISTNLSSFSKKTPTSLGGGGCHIISKCYKLVSPVA